MAYQPHRLRLSGAFIVERIVPIRRAQRDDRLLLQRLQKLIAAGKATTTRLLDTHAKNNAALFQYGRHPAAWIASVKQPQIILAKPVELFKQHPAFTDVGAVHRDRENQFSTAQKQAKHQLIGQGGALENGRRIGQQGSERHEVPMRIKRPSLAAALPLSEKRGQQGGGRAKPVPRHALFH